MKYLLPLFAGLLLGALAAPLIINQIIIWTREPRNCENYMRTEYGENYSPAEAV